MTSASTPMRGRRTAPPAPVSAEAGPEPGPESAPAAVVHPEASAEAKRLAAAILEVLAGLRGPSEAAQVLGISLCRYYQLENRALAGLLAGCEPLRRGRGRSSPSELVSLRHECERLRRDCARQQALVRAAQKTIGLAAPAQLPAPAPRPAGKSRKRRPRRPRARALKMAALLREETPPTAPPSKEKADVTPPASPNPTLGGTELPTGSIEE
jgi:hypothetical protein